MATTTVARPMSITLDISNQAEAWMLRHVCHTLGLACTIETKGWIFKHHEATILAADIDSLSYHARRFLLDMTRVAFAQMSA